MEIPLFKTKITPPLVQPNSLFRPSLILSLEEAFRNGRKLALLSAPAGYGKTTLLSQWLEREEHSAAWFSIDERDDQAPRFFRYWIAAISVLEESVSPTFQKVFQAPQFHPQMLVEKLIQHLQELPNEKLIFIFDDFQHIRQKKILESIDFLIRHLPVNVFLIVSTREDPILPLPVLRAKGEMVELRQKDFCLNEQESLQLLQKTEGIAVGPEDLKRFMENTEGWITGLHFAAIAARDVASSDDSDEHKGPGAVFRSFLSQRHYILEYLFEEILSKQPEPIRLFLTFSSIFERIGVELCDVVIIPILMRVLAEKKFWGYALDSGAPHM